LIDEWNRKMTMRSAGLIAVLAAFAIAAHAMPADAAPRKKASAQCGGVNQNTVVVTRDENGRTRTRIIVTPRSYLDGGTEVLPGQRKFTDYAILPYWTPLDVLGPGKNYDRQPLNPIWERGWTRGWY
jgi:hypothetical protein